jgi:hypothetical protein
MARKNIVPLQCSSLRLARELSLFERLKALPSGTTLKALRHDLLSRTSWSRCELNRAIDDLLARELITLQPMDADVFISIVASRRRR